MTDNFSDTFSAAMMGDFNEISRFISDQSADEILQRSIEYSRNTILHLASTYGHTESVEAILNKQSLLLCKLNYDGDTALHLAAKGGHTDIVRLLIGCVKKLDIESGWLHLAVGLSDQTDVPCSMLYNFITNRIINERIKNLQPWQVILQLKNKEGNTAVHEATRYNRIEVVTLLLNQDPEFKHSGNVLGETPLYMAASRGFHDMLDLIMNASGSPSFYGPDSRTALHGAVICNSEECTIKLLQWNKRLVHRRDRRFQTPLHYAAQLGFVNLVRELLKADASIAYVTNRKGRNVLHVAIKHRQKDVIEFLLEECPLLVNSLIAKKDTKGNTPLHLLAASNCLVPKLIHHPMADKGDLNKLQFTPLDLVIHHNNANSSTSAAENEVVEELKSGGVIRFQMTRESLLFDSDKVRKMIENHMVVAALIATVSFAAGFAMPGGYFQSGSRDQGMAVLSRNSVSFQAFVISDAVALNCSTGALVMYFFSVFTKGEALTLCAGFGYLLNLTGIGAIMVAFFTGTYAVLQYSHALAVATIVVGSYTTLCAYLILVLILRVVEELKSGGVIRFHMTRELPFDSDKVRKMIENHMVVAALIATVSFAAGFAMPGGYFQSGSRDQGMAVLSRNSVSFQAFVISDAVALSCSTGALVMYFISVLTKGQALWFCAFFGYGLNLTGLGAIMVAFYTGTYAVLQYSHALAVATIVVGLCIAFCAFMLLKLPVRPEMVYRR